MQELHLYEYAVIRVVPRVEREEFLNVGIVLFCKKAKFLRTFISLDATRLAYFCGEADPDQIALNLIAFEKITNGDKTGGRIALLETPERFRWLTAIRSSVIQTSRPHPGMSIDLEKTLERLSRELVL